MRTLEELIDTGDPGLPLIREWMQSPQAAGAHLLPRDEDLAKATLLRLQVTTRSLLGAVVYETGGITVRNGFLRLLGSGTGRSLLRSNEAIGLLASDNPKIVLVADDVLGGLFALNGGGLDATSIGDIFYLGADDSLWTSLEVGYSDFLSWCLTGDFMAVYAPLAELDVFDRQPYLELDAVYSFYPFLWSAEARRAPPSSRLVPANEHAAMRLELVGFATD